MASAGFDRRRSVRVNVHLAVHVARRIETIHTTVASDLSDGGMFIHELLPYEKGARLHVTFQVAGLDRVFACDAQVMHARSEFREGFPNSPIGNGLGFIDMPEEDREALASFVVERSV
jgi:c-di-GMP-binding flagellar brake protein YcgR